MCDCILFLCSFKKYLLKITSMFASDSEQQRDQEPRKKPRKSLKRSRKLGTLRVWKQDGLGWDQMSSYSTSRSCLPGRKSPTVLCMGFTQKAKECVLPSSKSTYLTNV